MARESKKEELKISWTAHPGQQRWALTRWDVRELLYGGARGGGKTDAGMVWLIQAPHYYDPHYRALVIRRTADDLSDWLDRAARMYETCGATITGKPGTVTFKHGPVFRLGHLRDDQAYQKYQGHEYHRMLIEELTQIPTEQQYLQLIASCRSSSDALPAQVFCTTNPGGPGHGWVRERWGIGRRIANVAYPIAGDGRMAMFIPATVEDNPSLLKNDPSYLGFLDALPEPLRSAWRHGSWDLNFGQAFDVVERIHGVDDATPIPEGAPVMSTFDWGYGKPFSWAWWWIDLDTDTVFRFAEWYGALDGQDGVGLRMTDSEVAHEILQREAALGIAGRVSRRYAGHDSWNKKPDYRGGGQGPSTAEVFEGAGLTLVRADPNREQKIRAVRERLAYRQDTNGVLVQPPRLRVYRRCKAWWRIMPYLVLDEVHQEDVSREQEGHVYDDTAQICMARRLDVGPRAAGIRDVQATPGAAGGKGWGW